jgi:tRNA pseudouridine13 synthase
MRPAQPVERQVGIAHYVSDTDGIGGRLRDRPEDFRVRELEAVDVQPTDADAGAYPDLVFRATLRRWDTNDFAAALAEKLGISRERVSWAGTKDKHAVTTQLFSVRDVASEELPEVDDADIEVLGRTGRPVLFGDLRGNGFEITVRDPERPENAAAIAEELRAFATDGADGDAADAPVGVPNYFGQQRFGSLRPVTHEVGLAVARGDYEAAVMAYVGNPSEREPESTQAARRFVEREVYDAPPDERDWAAALDRLPPRLGYERGMVHRLAERDGDEAAFRRALEAVPSNLRALFVNAAQSYLFNRMLSARLDRGLPFSRPVAGDVVCFTDGHGAPAPDRLQRVDADRVDTVARHCERGRAYVTAPLVGTETELGDGEPGEIERAVLDEAGIEPGDFDRPGEFGSAGTRRAILLRTDLSVTGDGDDALAFAFELPAGAYATVLMREFLKAAPGDL